MIEKTDPDSVDDGVSHADDKHIEHVESKLAKRRIVSGQKRTPIESKFPKSPLKQKTI